MGGGGAELNLRLSINYITRSLILNDKVYILVFKFIGDLLRSFYFSDFQCTSHQPVSVADFGLKSGIAFDIMYKIYMFLNFDLEGCSPAAPPLGALVVNTILFLFSPVMLGTIYVMWLL